MSKRPPADKLMGGNPYLNSGELALATAGQAAGFIGDVVGQGLSTVGDAITPDFLGVGKAGEAATQALMSSAPAQAVGEVILDFSEENPRAADTLGNLFNVSTLGAGGGILKAGATANTSLLLCSRGIGGLIIFIPHTKSFKIWKFKHRSSIEWKLIIRACVLRIISK